MEARLPLGDAEQLWQDYIDRYAWLTLPEAQMLQSEIHEVFKDGGILSGWFIILLSVFRTYSKFKPIFIRIAAL